MAACAQYAFMICSSLASVTIPDSVTSIGSVSLNTRMQPPVRPWLCGQHAAFKAAQCLSVLVAACVQQAFMDCSSLTSVTIPDSVTSIGEVSLNTRMQPIRASLALWAAVLPSRRPSA